MFKVTLTNNKKWKTKSVISYLKNTIIYYLVLNSNVKYDHLFILIYTDNQLCQTSTLATFPLINMRRGDNEKAGQKPMLPFTGSLTYYTNINMLCKPERSLTNKFSLKIFLVELSPQIFQIFTTLS